MEQIRMNPIENTAVAPATIKPVPTWLKFGLPLVLILMAGVIYILTKNTTASPAINIDPPGGVAANAAVNIPTTATVDKSVEKTNSSAKSPSLLPITSASTANSSSGPLAVAPVVSASATTAPTMPASNTTAPFDAGQQLTRLSEQLGQLQLLVNQLSDVSGQLNQRIAQLDERLPKGAAKQVTTPVVARRAFVKPVPSLPLPVAVNAMPTDVPVLVAVDSWDGRPSVSIRTARGIVFANEGDQVEGWQLVSTNARAQRAEFYRPQNGNVTVGAQPVLISAP
jgi:TolA-binding protein